MILVADPDELSPSARDLAQAFGLTPAESRLAAALLTGKRLSDIAAAAGVRITTLGPSSARSCGRSGWNVRPISYACSRASR
jgi:hypothetical protein